MNRNTHRFQFLGAEIAAAAKHERDYHRQRLVFWHQEQDQAVKTAKSAGIEIKEHPVTGGVDVQVVIDPTVQQRLNSCAAKLASHRSAADRFTIEADAYATQETRNFELDSDDVVYFVVHGHRDVATRAGLSCRDDTDPRLGVLQSSMPAMRRRPSGGLGVSNGRDPAS